jgi:NAD(P)-dependent dehydrogenase (short-subunit alcohol dehydrogenase family)
MDFTGKRILITGGSRGIGRACAHAFARRGGSVAVNYRRDEGAARDTIAALPGDGHLAIRADVSVPDDAERLVDEAAVALDGLDVVVNNAGVWIGHPLDGIDYDEWQEAWKRTLDLNLLGPANVCYCAARYMIEHGGGRIVNVSSRGAFRGEPEGPAYGASKAGLNAMSQSLARRLAPHNIYVGVVAPGFVDTDMASRVLDGPQGDEIRAQSPLNRVAKPEEIAQAVVFLAAEGSEWATGAVVDMNGASYLRT